MSDPFSRNWLGSAPEDILKERCDRKINILCPDCHRYFG